jgi:hypothetical protein
MPSGTLRNSNIEQPGVVIWSHSTKNLMSCVIVYDVQCPLRLKTLP